MLPAEIMIMSDGRILKPSGEPITQNTKKPGYRWITLWRDGKRKSYRVNRLVCEAFHGGPPFPGAQARHLDGNPANNAAGNLAWGTRAENEADKRLHGTDPAGERHGQAKLTWAKVREIRVQYAAGGVSQATLATKYGVHQMRISEVVRNKAWVDSEYIPPTWEGRRRNWNNGRPQIAS